MNRRQSCFSCVIFASMPRFTILLLLLTLFWVYEGLAMKPWCSLIDTALVDWSTSSIPVETHKECHLACLESPSCESANYWTRNETCELNSASHVNVSGRYLVEQTGSVYTYASEDGCHRAFGTTPRDVCTSSEYNISRGWRRVFKGVAGTGRKLYKLWTGQNWMESLEDKGSWRNNKLHDAWQSGQLIVKRVRLSLWVGTETKVQLMFNGTGSDINSWFSQENLISSPWSDLKHSSNDYTHGYYFSVDGYEPADRRFYINYSWGGCGIDLGWLVVTESSRAVCGWEQPTEAHPYSIILYSATKNKVVWRKAANVGRADFLTIDVETE